MAKSIDWIDGAARTSRDRRCFAGAKREGSQGPVIVLDGQKLVNFGSNDYLGLAADPRLTAAVRQSLDEYGWGGALR